MELMQHEIDTFLTKLQEADTAREAALRAWDKTYHAARRAIYSKYQDMLYAIDHTAQGAQDLKELVEATRDKELDANMKRDQTAQARIMDKWWKFKNTIPQAVVRLWEEERARV